MHPSSWLFRVTVFLCVGVAGYALWAYGSGVQRVPVHPEMIANFDRHRALITTHAVGASFALLLGPFQFVTAWRARAPRLHRLLGYGYLGLGVGVGGIAGVLLAPRAFGGLPSALGFGLLGVLWLATGVMAFITARRRQFERHRAWMIRNFALALAAVTLRLYLPAGAIARIPFEVSYPIIAWLCWVPNLLVAELWLARRRAPSPATA